MPASIFADEWRECLRAHYTTVIRNDDHLTERTLRGVMIHEAGFTEAELKELQVRATMRVEDAPTDFVPDLDILQGDSVPHTVAVAMPQEVIQAMVAEEALDHDAQADAAIEEATEADALQLDISDPAAETPSADAALSDALMLDDALDMDDSELMDVMLDGDESADTPTAELLAETLDVDDAELPDRDDESEDSDEAQEDEPPPDPEGAQQLSLF
jgi:hypothetical protein